MDAVTKKVLKKNAELMEQRKQPPLAPYLQDMHTGYVIPWSWQIYQEKQHYKAFEGPVPENQLKNAHTREKKFEEEKQAMRPIVQIDGLADLLNQSAPVTERKVRGGRSLAQADS